MQDALKEFSVKLLKPLPEFRTSVVEQVMPLAGDASRRQFFRIVFSQGALKQTVLIRNAHSSEKAFVELSRFFLNHGLRVPKVYHWSETEHAILVEDVGELALWRFAEDRLPEAGQAIKDKLGDEYKRVLFEKAIQVITQFQSIPADKNCIAFQRSLSFSNYRSEAQEFIEHYAEPKHMKHSERTELGKLFDALCETVASFPAALSHFDFTAHNLFVSPEGDIRVLDFQDAKLTSPVRDIVSLINDRGMDEILGRSLHTELLKTYRDTLSPGPHFAEWYDLTLLHWDFRVTGRFHKLTAALKTDTYLKWIPSTLRRLGRTLQRSYQRIHGMESALEILERFSPEVKEGISDPWALPDSN